MENIPNLQEILTNIIVKLINQLVDFVPKLVTTIVIIFIGYWIAKLIAFIVNKILEKVGIDKISEKLQEISIVKESKLEIKFSVVISKALYYFILLVFITTGAEILGVSALTDIIHSIVNFIPRLISGAIMLIVGLVVAESIKNGVVTLCKSFNVPSGRLIGSAVFFFFLTVLILGVLAQIGINTDLLESSFNIIIGGLVLAFSIGYGMASRDILANILASFYSKGKYTEGQNIRVDAVEGTIIAIDNTTLTVQTKESTVVLPLQFLQSKKVEIL
jgi:flagellar biosynthesis protein FliQ